MTELTRRSILLGLGAGAIAAACSDGNPETSPSNTTSTTAAAEPATTAPAGVTLASADFESAGTCVPLRPAPAGPFGLSEQFRRSDITDGYPGHALELGIRITDIECRPQPDAEVEIWHADATGDYSAFTDNGTGKDEGEGTTFLRGTQTTDQHGIVSFATIAPGWYPGRAVHIHITVRLADGTARTGQLYFDEEFLTRTYGEAAYVDNGTPDTTNSTDGIAGELTTAMLLTPTPQGNGSRALTTLTI